MDWKGREGNVNTLTATMGGVVTLFDFPFFVCVSMGEVVDRKGVNE